MAPAASAPPSRAPVACRYNSASCRPTIYCHLLSLTSFNVVSLIKKYIPSYSLLTSSFSRWCVGVDLNLWPAVYTAVIVLYTDENESTNQPIAGQRGGRDMTREKFSQIKELAVWRRLASHIPLNNYLDLPQARHLDSSNRTVLWCQFYFYVAHAYQGGDCVIFNSVVLSWVKRLCFVMHNTRTNWQTDRYMRPEGISPDVTS